MSRIRTLEPKDPGETFTLTFNFASDLGDAETISSATVDVTVVRGSDGNPSALLSGADSNTTTTVSQKITGGSNDTDYKVKVTATTSASNIFVLAAIVPVRTL